MAGVRYEMTDGNSRMMTGDKEMGGDVNRTTLGTYAKGIGSEAMADVGCSKAHIDRAKVIDMSATVIGAREMVNAMVRR